MNVNDVAAEIAEKLDAISGLRAFGYPVGKLPLPGAIVALPDDIMYDETYGRGSDDITFPVFVLVPGSDYRAAAQDLMLYLSGSGAQSVKAAVDSTNTNAYTSCDTVTVTRATTGAYTYNGVDTFGAEFTVRVTGSGS